jgi:hypothetical protein
LYPIIGWAATRAVLGIASRREWLHPRLSQKVAKCRTRKRCLIQNQAGAREKRLLIPESRGSKNGTEWNRMEHWQKMFALQSLWRPGKIAKLAAMCPDFTSASSRHHIDPPNLSRN